MRTLLQESEHLDLIRPGEYGLYKCLCLHSSEKDKSYVARCARLLVRHLQIHGLLSPGWSSRAGRVRVHNSLLVELWNPGYALLGLQDDDAVLKAAVASLVSDIP